MSRRLGLLGLFFLFCSGVLNASGPDSWTWSYKKRFSRAQQQRNKNKKTLLFTKDAVPKFSQLIFSWNAFRPVSGKFTFFIQVRDSKTGAWGKWYKMMDWGAGIQRSYFGSQHGNAKYVYVRLEADKKQRANGFRTKILAQGGADLRLLKGFSVCISDFSQFAKEDVSASVSRLPSVYVRGVPKKSQMNLDHPRAAHMCSPTSCSMLVGFLRKKKVDPLYFAQKSFDEGLNTYGSWPFNVARAFELCGGKFFFSVARLSSFKTMHHFLKKGIPLLVSVRGALKGAPKVYDNGHLLLVVGWDAKRKQVICHDPALKEDYKVLKRYEIKSFLAAWERSHRLAYVADRGNLDVRGGFSNKGRMG